MKPNLKELLLFIHAFGGCDTTSAIHEKSKGSIVKMVEKSPDAMEIGNVFLNEESTQDQVGEAGMKAFIKLYGGGAADSLSGLRHRS